jgi:integrase
MLVSPGTASWCRCWLMAGYVSATRCRCAAKHLDVAGGRVVVDDAVTELPGGPIIDTPKDHQRRELLVPAFVVEAVRRHLATVPDDRGAFVFPGRQKHTASRQQSYSGFRRRFRRAVAAAGLEDVTPHDLRATHASWVADSHGVMTAARRLGHANASVTTRHYARPMDERDAQVAKHLDKLGIQPASGTQRARKSRIEAVRSKTYTRFRVCGVMAAS